MKRFFFYLLMFSIFFLTGCGSKEEKLMTCKMEINESDVKINLTYNVMYVDNIVTKVEKSELITSDDDDILDVYKEEMESIYAPYSDLEHYDYSISVDNNTLICYNNIDYSKVDTNKMLDIDSTNGILIKDGKININIIEYAYEELGATCEK